MADDSLRMQAEVVDKFSGPLRNLRAQLLGISREGATHSETVAKGIGKIEGAARTAGQAASTVLNPALAAIGVTGLGATAALAGTIAALRNLGGSVASLGQLGRETGMAADQLRVFQSLVGRFGISSDAADAGAKRFAENMRDIRRGVGETMGFLQSQSPEIAKFAQRLRGTTNNDEARKLAEDFLESIPNAVDRQRFAEKLFGNADFGRLGDKHLGPLRKLREEINRALGPLDPAAVKSAEEFERAIAQLRTTMQRLGTAIATEAMPHVSEFVKGLESIVKGGREDITGPLREGIRELGEALKKIDWTAAAEGAREFIKGATSGIRTVIDGLRALNEGKYLEAFRLLEGGSGPLARRLAPLPGDEVIAQREGAERDLTDKQALLDRNRRLLSGPNGAAYDTPEMRARNQKLTEEIERLTAELKRLREGQRQKADGSPTVQQQSFDPGLGSFGGARIYSASLGGGGGFSGGVGSGGYHGGSRISPVPSGPAGSAGRLQGLGGSSAGNLTSLIEEEAKRAGIDPRIMQGIRAGESHRGSQYDVKSDAREDSYGPFQLNRRGGLGASFEKETGLNLRDPSTIPAQARWVAAHIAKRLAANPGYNPGTEWYGYKGARDADASWGDSGYTTSREGTPGRGSANFMRGQLGAPGENLTTITTASGKRLTVHKEAAESFRGFVDELEGTGYKIKSLGGYNMRRIRGGSSWSQHAYGNAIDINPATNPMGYGPLQTDLPPDVSDRAARWGLSWGGDWKRRKDAMHFEWNGTRPWLKQNGMTADGAGFDAAVKRLRPGPPFGDEDGGASLLRRAVRAGATGATPRVDANGAVNIRVEEPGPDTRVRTSASGDLFKNINLKRGRAMAEASQTN